MSEVSLSKLRTLVHEDKRTALVLFRGSWCSDCIAFVPVWTAWTSGRKGPIFEVEVAKGGKARKEWNLDEIPTVALFINGSEEERVDGPITSLDLDELWDTAQRKVLALSRRGDGRGQR